MSFKKWLALAVALGMMGATGGYLINFHKRMHLGKPGVVVGRESLFDENGHLAATNSVLLPVNVLGLRGKNLAVTVAELDALPKDTTFGRKLYRGPEDFNVLTSVVLMGSDRTSIHQPQYCLVAQNWKIDKSESVLLPMELPHPYQLPALKLTASQTFKDKENNPILVRGIYVYWFVSAEEATAGEGTRFWSIAKTMVEKGELERWAYISYFATCLPGHEEDTFDRMKRFIRASVPDFQVVPVPAR